jgi:DeoR family suf operon transcriptional repressor
MPGLARDSHTLWLTYCQIPSIFFGMVGTQQLPGFRGTRAEVLVTVKKSQPVTAKELAAALKVTPNALRRHLKELESEGVVAYRREVRGVGGPVFEYSLTDRGERLFPRAYEETLSEALSLVRREMGDQGLVTLFQRRWDALAEAMRPQLEALTLAERAKRLAELLSSLGYMAESPAGASSMLREHNCTIRAVAERFPEVCAAEQRFIQDVLGVAVTRQAHIASGANCCDYCLSSAAPGARHSHDSLEAPAPDVASRIEAT